MERVPQAKQSVLASNRLFGKDRLAERQKAEKEARRWQHFEGKEPPYRSIYNQRQGILAETTQLNVPLADELMRRTDMRKTIVVKDVYEPPQQACKPQSDILAASRESLLPPQQNILLHQEASHCVTISDAQVTIGIYDRVIDQQIQQTPYRSHKQYQDMYLAVLNHAVKSGISQALLYEKFNLSDFGAQYLYLAATLGIIATSRDQSPELAILALPTVNTLLNMLLTATHKISQELDETPKSSIPASVPRDIKGIFKPAIPFDSYLKGQYMLKRFGNKLLIPKPSLK